MQFAINFHAVLVSIKEVGFIARMTEETKHILSIKSHQMHSEMQTEKIIIRCSESLFGTLKNEMV